jgi:hypothetical protein
MQHPYFEQVREADRKRLEEEERARRGEAGEFARRVLFFPNFACLPRLDVTVRG